MVRISRFTFHDLSKTFEELFYKSIPSSTQPFDSLKIRVDAVIVQPPPPENWRLAGKAKLSATQNQVVTEVQYRALVQFDFEITH